MSNICAGCKVPDKICGPHPDCVVDVWNAARKSVERRKTVRAKRPVQHAEVDICPWCNGEGVRMSHAGGPMKCRVCSGSGKRPTVG